MRLYKSKCYLPINRTDRKRGSLIFILSKTIDDTIKVINNPCFININSFLSYYIERNVMFFLNENNEWIPADRELIHEYITKKERDSITEKDFGLPEDRKYPLDSPEHVHSAIRLFGKCEEDKKHILAKNIMKAAKKYGIEVKKDTEVYKYAHQTAIDELINEAYIYDGVREFIDKIPENTAQFREDHIRLNVEGVDLKIYYNDKAELLEEASATTQKLKHLLFHDRMTTNKDQLNIYDEVKKRDPKLQFMYINIPLYRARNLFVDTSYYMGLFFKNNFYRLDVALDLFKQFILRNINDKRYDQFYTKKTIFVDVKAWNTPGIDIFDFHNPNPISLIYRHQFRRNIQQLQRDFGDWEWVFMSDKAFFKLTMNDLDQTNVSKFKGFINKLINDDLSDVEIDDRDSTDAAVTKFIDRLETRGIQINNITGSTKDLTIDDIKKKLDKSTSAEDGVVPQDHEDSTSDASVKKALIVQHIAKLANSSSEDDIMDAIDSSSEEEREWLYQTMEDLESEEGDVEISKARASRMSKLNSEFMKKKLNGRSIKDYLDSNKNKKIEKDTIPIDSINEEWKDVTFSNFNEVYNLDDDMVSIFSNFTNKSIPLSILDIEKTDNTTSEDAIDVWNVKFEDVDGKRFSIKLDIPKFIDNKFMKLRGNLKTINGQLMLIPVIKTDEDTAQIVSNYNKIFINRVNPSNGTKTSPAQSRLTKILNKYKGNTMKVIIGDSTLICKKYELPIEYRDLAGIYNSIEFKDGTVISFNMDYLKECEADPSYKKEANMNNNIPYMIDTKRKVIYYTEPDKVSNSILNAIAAHSVGDKELIDIMDNAKPSDKLSYSNASILNADIPVIVVMAYTDGLQKAMNKANIKFTVEEKRPTDGRPYVRFSDGYIAYEYSLEASLLMAGLSKVDTEAYSVKSINDKNMWTDVLDDFGGRIKADGLDNFADLMIDPITKEICEIYGLPTDYVTILGYASSLLVDTKYNKHTDISGNRLRTNEIVAGYAYKIISKAYGDYKTAQKRNKTNAQFTIKQSAVVDAILMDPTAQDLSVLTPVLEADALAAVTFKGLSGLNSERSYSLDKRVYDESMQGVLGMSTGFAGNVGITRQLSVNANIASSRGIIKPLKGDKLNTLNMLTANEAMTPYQTTHDDATRVAMGYIQFARHSMRVKRSSPNLVTMGMDEALPYITSNIFSHKFRGKRGKVLDVTDKWIVYQDIDTKEVKYVSLEEKVMKNSDGGFYVTVKLAPNVKKGQTLTYNSILAYDKSSYSKPIAADKDMNGLSYNSGTMISLAIMQSSEGYNDATTVTEKLAESLTMEFCIEKARYLPKDANVYNVIKKGTPIREGDPLMVFQNAFDEKDANELLKSITDDELEAVSDLGRIHVRSKITGIVQDVKIYRTCDVDQLSESLKKLVTDYERSINKDISSLKKYGVSEEDIKGSMDPTYKLPPQGKIKDAIDGVKIVFYIKATDKYGIGDKLIYGIGLKGVCSDMIHKGDEPYTDLHPNCEVSGILTTAGMNARMVTSVIMNGLLNKVLVELDRQCKDALGIPWKDFNDMNNENF